MIKLVAYLLLAVAALCVTAKRVPISERSGHQINMHERLGHFRRKPFIDLYKVYAVSLPTSKNVPREHIDRYLPSDVKCLPALKEFVAHNYTLVDLDGFVMIDACLGYMYDSDFEVTGELEALSKKEELRSLWEGTNIDDMSYDAKLCVADLLYSQIAAKIQHPDVVCNNHFLQIFIQFAECQQEFISFSSYSDDSYLNFLLKLLRERVQECITNEIGLIEEAVRKAYQRRRTERVRNIVKSRFSPMSKLAANRMWPKSVVELFTAVQNTTTEINQHEIHQLIRGVYKNDEKIKRVFLDNMAEHATKAIKPSVKRNQQDPTGLKRYTRYVDKLCSFFRTSDSEENYDYVTPMIRMVRLLAHKDLFQVEHDKFIQTILTRAKESGTIYMGVQACNILTYTEGILAKPTANAKQCYQVFFKHDSSGMIVWPVADFY